MKRWLAMMGFVSLAATGCATTPRALPLTLTEADARQFLLERTANEVLYRRSPDEVMAVVRAVLEEQGYLIQPGSDPDYVHTEWKGGEGNHLAGRMSRYLVTGQTLADGRFMVRAHELVLSHGGQVLLHPSGLANLPRNMDNVLHAPIRGTTGLAFYAGTPLALGTPMFRRAPGLQWAILSRLEPGFTAAVEQQVDLYVANHRPPEEVDETL